MRALRCAVTIAAVLVAGLGNRAEGAGKDVRDWLRGGTWPASALLPIETGPVPKGDGYKDLHKQDFGHGDPWAGTGRVAEARPVEGTLPGAGASPGKPAPTKEQLEAARAAKQAARAELEEQIQAHEAKIIELDEAATSVLQVGAGTKQKDLLRPVLMFLVERGVLKAGEVEPMLADAERNDKLLERIGVAMQDIRAKRDALQVRNYLLGE